MKGTSKLIMGATLVMVVSLVIVLALVLVLLAELYCSLLLRKRRLRITTTTTTANTNTAPSQSQQDPSSTLSSVYAHGVLRAPRSFLFPAIISKEEINKQYSKSDQIPEIRTQEAHNTPHRIGLISASSPSPSFISSSPHPIQDVALEGSSNGDGGEHFVYISNPIYDNDACRPSGVGTPFETPDTSPSRLEMGGSSGEDENVEESQSSPSSLPMTPPLTPMKKLPVEACSVSLRDARSLGTSGSGSDSNNGLSSSSSGSPCTSPSW